MKGFLLFICFAVWLGMSSWVVSQNSPEMVVVDSIRTQYEQPIAKWPKPTIDSGVVWKELGIIPEDTLWRRVDTDPKASLGKMLFFDPRLSSSDQISCSSCHDPDLAWQDGRVISLGNDHLQGTRNTPTIMNSYIFDKLFWDGRASDYQAQAVNPIKEHHELNMNIERLPEKLQQIKGYISLFNKAYESDTITVGRITDALAAFQVAVRSRKTKFDKFMMGDYKQMNDQELMGLHLFRTKARCMNCHNGVFLTDGDFHNIGLTYYRRKYQDLGRYEITKDTSDIGKFRTPSLRELNRTRPWMHNGLFNDLEGIVNMYNSGMPQLPKNEEQRNDPMFPKTDVLLKPLDLTVQERKNLVAFLNTMNGVPFRMMRPVLPK
jgi:cytochrome c peroxidase